MLYLKFTPFTSHILRSSLICVVEFGSDNKYYVNQNRKVPEKAIFGNDYEMDVREYNLIYYMRLELTT